MRRPSADFTRQDATGASLRPLILDIVDTKSARLMSNRHPAYRSLVIKDRPSMVNHEETYVDGGVDIQGIKNY